MPTVSAWHWLVVLAAATGAVYVAFVVLVLVCGRGRDAAAVARFIPDCLVLIRRVLRDERVSRTNKLLLLALVGYLAMPVDLVPDVIPVAGQLDDAILVMLVLRRLLRATGPDLLHRHWPGPPASRDALARLLFGAGGVRPRAAPRPPVAHGASDRRDWQATSDRR